LLEKVLTPDVSVQDGLNSRSIVAMEFLGDVENGDMGGNSHFTAGKGIEQCRFTNTVLANKTIAMAVC
jgi:hypothetical protein